MSTGSASLKELAQNDNLSRTPGRYAVDALTHEHITDMQEGLLDDTILVREKKYFYTTENTSLEAVMSRGRPSNIYGKEKGDWDVALIHLGDQTIEHFEVTTAEGARKKERSENHYSPEQQCQRIENSLEVLNKTKNTSWDYEQNVVIAEDWEMMIEGSVPRYGGEQYCLEGVKSKADELEEFIELDNGIFDGTFWHGGKIHRK